MLFSNFGYLKHWKLLNVCHSRLEILPNINKPSKDCQRVLKNGQSGKISPNLVTLVARNSWFISPPAPKKKLKRKFHNALAKLNCKWSLKMQHSRQHFYLHFALAYYSIKKSRLGIRTRKTISKIVWHHWQKSSLVLRHSSQDCSFMFDCKITSKTSKRKFESWKLLRAVSVLSLKVYLKLIERVFTDAVKMHNILSHFFCLLHILRKLESIVEML